MSLDQREVVKAGRRGEVRTGASKNAAGHDGQFFVQPLRFERYLENGIRLVARLGDLQQLHLQILELAGTKLAGVEHSIDLARATAEQIACGVGLYRGGGVAMLAVQA